MRISGLCFTSEIIHGITKTVEVEPSISRRELSRRLCQKYNWRSPNGNLKDMSCRKALLELERRNLVSLPEAKALAFKQSSDPIEIEVARVRCSLPGLGQVMVRPISSRYCKESRIWRSLLDSYHSLGSGPLCGAQIRYLVKSSIYGPIGAMAFSSATFALAARDKHIGWTETARRANLAQVICNARFLIVPSVQVPNLASHVLSLALRRLASDWEKRYSVLPVLVETFVDPRRWSGTCYKAANWQEVGRTAGRRDGVAKMIFIRHLCSDWREKLCQASPVPLGAMERPLAPANWAEAEFGTVRFYDERLKKRLHVLAQDFYNNPEANIPEACGSKARTMAAYRFFQNKAVSMDVLLTPHIEATIERSKEQAVVLAPQDTTTLDYNTHFLTEGLGPTNGEGKGGLGLLLHDTLAFTTDGTPLGILDAQCWARDPHDGGKKKRNTGPKESKKWLHSFQKVAQIQRLCSETMFVSIGDRESDIYELFAEANKDPNGPKLLVRSERSRRRKVQDQYLWDHMAACDVAGMMKIYIPRSGSRKARDAWVEVRFDKVELSPPKRYQADPAFPIWAVYLLEHDPDEDVKSPVEWLLLTTASVETLEDATTRVEWYRGRWGIEVYHRTLKSGCRIRDRQLGAADRLEACLGIDMVVAWRIYHLTMLGRETPHASCTIFFQDVEWKALCCYVSKSPIPPREPPTLEQAIRMLGQMGGHLGRKGDGPPGTQVLWRGLQRLETAAEMYELFNEPPQNRSP